MLGINLKVGVEATLQRLNAHSKGRQFKDLSSSGATQLPPSANHGRA
jgi:hypothetical protein